MKNDKKATIAGQFIPCPFHKEKTPSCYVELRKKTFRCFGCGAAGKVTISATMKMVKSTTMEKK